ncbi:hypothetical protein QTJ16_007075 [Diplocarpon rosae]|uniref:Uncharacterized protein n=1 Tax=Diplocarpon rosae TaxID=946125 RepID=A0AAD9WBR2_9HELO|nr:hypothetical protein QTJ16_007075 [Diplocarpon rosae]
MADQTSSTVTALVSKLHANIDSIHACIASLSDTAKHDAELERLSDKRETKLAVLHATYRASLTELITRREKERRDIEDRRQKDKEDLEAERKRELEDLMERRRREDEDREQQFRKEETAREEVQKEEDEQMQSEREKKEKELTEDVEVEMERLEDEIERIVEEGKVRLRGLDEERKNINADIEKALSAPITIPSIQFRSRAKAANQTGKDEEGSANRRFTWNETSASSSREQNESQPLLALGRRKSQGAETEQADAISDTQVRESMQNISSSTLAAPDGERQFAGFEDEQFKALYHAGNESAASKFASTAEDGRSEGIDKVEDSEATLAQDPGKNAHLGFEMACEGRLATSNHETGSQGDAMEMPQIKAILDGSSGSGTTVTVERLDESKDEATGEAASELSGVKAEVEPQDLILTSPDAREKFNDEDESFEEKRGQSETGSLTERASDGAQDVSIDEHERDMARLDLQIDTGDTEKSVLIESSAVSPPWDNTATNEGENRPLETDENQELDLAALGTLNAEHGNDIKQDVATLRQTSSTPDISTESPAQAKGDPEGQLVGSGDEEMASEAPVPVAALALDAAVGTKSEDELRTNDTEQQTKPVAREDLPTTGILGGKPGLEDIFDRVNTASESSSVPDGEIHQVETPSETVLDKDETPSTGHDYGEPNSSVESKEFQIHFTDALDGNDREEADPSSDLKSLAKDASSPETEHTAHRAINCKAQAAADSQNPASRSRSSSAETEPDPDLTSPSQSTNMCRPSSRIIYMRHSRLLSTDSVQSIQSEEEIFLSNASRVRASKSIEDLYPELQLRNLDAALEEGDEGPDVDQSWEIDGGGSVETIMSQSGNIKSVDDSGSAGDGDSHHEEPEGMSEPSRSHDIQQHMASAESRPDSSETSEPSSILHNEVSDDSFALEASHDNAEDHQLASYAEARALEELSTGSPEQMGQVLEIEPQEQESITKSNHSIEEDQTPTLGLSNGHSQADDTVDDNSEHIVLEADGGMEICTIEPESIESAIQGASNLPEAVGDEVSSSTQAVQVHGAEMLLPSGEEGSTDTSVTLGSLDSREVANFDAPKSSIKDLVPDEGKAGHSSGEVAPFERSNLHPANGAEHSPESKPPQAVEEERKESSGTKQQDSASSLEQDESPESVGECEMVQGDNSRESEHPVQDTSKAIGSRKDAKSEIQVEKSMPERVDEQNITAPPPMQTPIQDLEDVPTDLGFPTVKAHHAKPSVDSDSASSQHQLESVTPETEFASVFATPLFSTPIRSSDSLIMDELESQNDMMPIDGTSCRSYFEQQPSAAASNVLAHFSDEGTGSAKLPELRVQDKSFVTIAEDHSDSFKDLNTLVEKHSVSLGRTPDEVEEKGKGHVSWPLPAAGTLAVDTPRRQASPSTQDSQQNHENSIDDNHTTCAGPVDMEHLEASAQSSKSMNDSEPRTETPWRDTWITVEQGQIKPAAQQLTASEAWPLQEAHRQVHFHEVEVHAGEEHVAQQAVSETAFDCENAPGTDSEGEWSGDNEYEQEVRTLETQRNIGSLRPRLGAESGNDHGRPRSWLGRHPESSKSILATENSFDENAHSASEDEDEDEEGSASSPGDIADQYFEQIETPLEVVPEHEPLNYFNDTYIAHRSSGLLANIVDTIRSDIPAVKKLQVSESAEYNNGQESASRARAVSFEDPEPGHAQNLTPQNESLRSRSHTADTVPSFASYAQSDSIPTTPSDTDSNSFIQDTRGEPAIQTSWPGSDIDSSPPQPPRYEPSKEAGFGPSLASAYPGYTSPKPSMEDLEGIEEGDDLFPRGTKQAWPMSNAGFNPMGTESGLEAHRAQFSPERKNTFGVSSSNDPTDVAIKNPPGPSTPNPANSPDSKASHHLKSSSPSSTQAPSTPRKIPTTPPRLPLHKFATSPLTTSRPRSASPTSQISPFPVSLSPGHSQGSISPGALFAKRREVFEAASPQGSPGLAPSPITALSATRGPVRRPGGSRTSSLCLSERAERGVGEPLVLGSSITSVKGFKDVGNNGDGKQSHQKEDLVSEAGDHGKIEEGGKEDGKEERKEEEKKEEERKKTKAGEGMEEEEGEGEFMLRSLDGDDKPPSPVFAPPIPKFGEQTGSANALRDEEEDLLVGRKRGSGFLGGLSRFVGGGERGGVKEPLLGE